jgi:hypothetical protein
VTRTNRNFVAAYIVLVALPVLGLAAVLRSERNLAAPIALGGQWRIQIDAAKLAALPCEKSLFTSEGAGFTISQSGKNFTLNRVNSPMLGASGQIEGTVMKATIPTSAEGAQEAGCGGRIFSLTATVDPKANPLSLEGKLSVDDCSTCLPVEFRAIREDQARAKGGH